ncbi:transposase [Thioclava sp. BHET1]|nr:transposase [Thioclava sp. BHET1]
MSPPPLRPKASFRCAVGALRGRSGLPPPMIGGRVATNTGAGGSCAMAIGSERRLCDAIHLNLAYRWFCRLKLEGRVPDRLTLSRYRNGTFRESNRLRHIFEAPLERCLGEGVVLREGCAVDANKLCSIAAQNWSHEVAREAAPRAA